MVVEEILRQLDSLGVSHEAAFYRTGGGAEVDLVLETPAGRVAVEIKHSSAVTARELHPVRDFVAQHGVRLGVVVNNDLIPRLLDDRIVGLPFTHL